MRRVVLVSCVVGLLLPATAHAQRTGRLLVSVTPPAAAGATDAATARAAVARNGVGSISRGVPELGLVAVRPRIGETLRGLADRLRKDSRVRAVDIEHRAQSRALPNDPGLAVVDPAPEAGGESLQWWAVRSNFPAAWELADGDSATVAVIDQGVDATHPDLAPKIRSTDDFDGDRRNGPATVDETGHGTHVSSLACAEPGNGVGIAGAGFACGLIVVKSDLSDESLVRSIVAATKKGADVISMSIGTDDRQHPPQAIVDAVDYAYGRGVVLVAAASDRPTTEQGDPANILQPTGTGPNLDAGKGLSVTAADFTGQKARFAGDGSQISIAAYGAFDRAGPNGVIGAFPAVGARPRIEIGLPASNPCGCRSDALGGDDRFAFLEGTSMATPIVAGAAALVRDLNPDLGPGDVIRLLKETAQRRRGSVWGQQLGWGIVDAEAAVRGAARLDRRPPASAVSGPSVASGSVVLRLAAEDPPGPPGVSVAGVRRVRVYARRGNGRARVVATTNASTVRIAVRPGGRYTFFSRALDRAGNLENPPARPDARVTVPGIAPL